MPVVPPASALALILSVGVICSAPHVLTTIVRVTVGGNSELSEAQLTLMGVDVHQ